MLGPLWLVVHQDDFAGFQRSGSVQVRMVTPKKDYIGLRESPEEAFKRYQLIFGDKVPTAELVMVCVEFTETGFAHYASDICDASHFFCPRLSKKIFDDSTTDWGVWHFIGDLPLTRTEMLRCTLHKVNELP